MVEGASCCRHGPPGPALPSCGLALAEAERYLPSLIDEVEEIVEELGLSKEEFTVRMTGCPNGCARPYMSDIGLVGRTLGKYNLVQDFKAPTIKPLNYEDNKWISELTV